MSSSLETVFPKTGSACRSEFTSVLILTGAHLDVGTEQALPHRKDQQLLLRWQEGDLCHLSSQEPIIQVSIWPRTLLLSPSHCGSASAVALEESSWEDTSGAWLAQWRQWHGYIPLHPHTCGSISTPQELPSELASHS